MLILVLRYCCCYHGSIWLSVRWVEDTSTCANILKRQLPTLDEKNEGNCGPIDCTTFNS